MGVRQGSVLLSLLFICLMDVLTERVRRICRSLMQADNVSLIGESTEEAMGRMKNGRKQGEKVEI